LGAAQQADSLNQLVLGLRRHVRRADNGGSAEYVDLRMKVFDVLHLDAALDVFDDFPRVYVACTH
jgi:hypothetical protein